MKHICDNCIKLQDKIDLLEYELSNLKEDLGKDNTLYKNLQTKLNLSKQSIYILVLLYNAKGRTIENYKIIDVIHDEAQHISNGISSIESLRVTINSIRKELAKYLDERVLLCVRSQGYYLNQKGIELVDQLYANTKMNTLTITRRLKYAYQDIPLRQRLYNIIQHIDYITIQDIKQTLATNNIDIADKTIYARLSDLVKLGQIRKVYNGRICTYINNSTGV